MYHLKIFLKVNRKLSWIAHRRNKRKLWNLCCTCVYELWTYSFIKISKKLNLKCLLGMETTTYVGFEGNFMSRQAHRCWKKMKGLLFKCQCSTVFSSNTRSLYISPTSQEELVSRENQLGTSHFQHRCLSLPIAKQSNISLWEESPSFN